MLIKKLKNVKSSKNFVIKNKDKEKYLGKFLKIVYYTNTTIKFLNNVQNKRIIFIYMYIIK